MNAAPATARLGTAFIDVDEWREAPARHRYVHGGIDGSATRFSLYLPPPENYEGRFFQYVTPVPGSETASQGLTGPGDRLGFTLASGAYFVESNGGGTPGPDADPLTGAYLANATVAEHSRRLAAQMYGPHRPYGYAFGGSGGAFRTIGGFENTDVWDGVVPFVVGSPMAIPNVFTVRMHAMRVLQRALPGIADALDAGGSGDAYAALSADEAGALREATKLGFPPQAWFGHRSMGVHAFAALYGGLRMADPTYFDDFWSVPGYLGADCPAELEAARVRLTATVQTVITEELASRYGIDPPDAHGDTASADSAWKAAGHVAGERVVALKLSRPLPAVQFLGGDVTVETGAAAGRALLASASAGTVLVLDVGDPAASADIRAGDRVHIDNSGYLAAQTYHRHQVPPGSDYPVWDQFRDAAGEPRYPQRPLLLGPLFTEFASGVVPTGRFAGKMIMVESLWDREAFAWQADWYRARIAEQVGADAVEERFRLWYVDRALHDDSAEQQDPTQTVSYLGVVQQALRDVSTWVERGIAPAASSRYEVSDGQVVLAPAASRRGVQPEVALLADGSKRADVAPGRPVRFTASVTVPPAAGAVVCLEWDFEGTGEFTAVEVPPGTDDRRLAVSATHAYPTPGRYFAVLRATVQRDGDRGTPYAGVQHLDRARIVVG